MQRGGGRVVVLGDKSGVTAADDEAAKAVAAAAVA